LREQGVVRSPITWAAAVVLVGAALFAVGGCVRSSTPVVTNQADVQADERAADLADTLREEALKLPSNSARERLVSGLVTLRDVIRTGGGKAADLADTLHREALNLPPDSTRERLVLGLVTLKGLLKPEVAENFDEPSVATSAAAASLGLPMPEGGGAAPAWATMFAPKSLVIGFFTRSKNFGGAPGAAEGIEVRLQPLDQFGDPTKAIGSYRVEVFEYRPRSGEKRGVRLGHWFVSVLDVDSTRKYYDSVDRSYVFPLLWEKPIAAGTSVIVQATYYPPAGFQDKLFAQRVIKIGAEGE
jgi:hypothetical protein